MKTVLINLPGAYLGVLHGIKDILDFADSIGSGTFNTAIVDTADIASLRSKPDLCVLPALRLPSGVDKTRPDSGLIRKIKSWSALGCVPVSVCAGALYIAASGLADGRTLTTHWKMSDALQRAFPRVRVQKEKMLIDEGLYVCAGGITGFQDLCLYLIKKYISLEAALETARYFLINPVDRNQLEYTRLKLDIASQSSLTGSALAAIHSDPGKDLSTETLARTAAVTARTLQRRFKSEGLETPARMIRMARMETARSLLETTVLPLKSVAAECGYSDVVSFSRAFRKLCGLNPGEYRKRHRLSPASAG